MAIEAVLRRARAWHPICFSEGEEKTIRPTVGFVIASKLRTGSTMNTSGADDNWLITHYRSSLSISSRVRVIVKSFSRQQALKIWCRRGDMWQRASWPDMDLTRKRMLTIRPRAALPMYCTLDRSSTQRVAVCSSKSGEAFVQPVDLG